MSSTNTLIAGADRAIIIDTRKAFIYPFVAPNWRDLRIGFFLSICKATDDHDVTGLAETLVATTPADRMWIGIKQDNDIKPNTAGTSFCGYSNAQTPDVFSIASKVASSDIGTGTTNSDYWRVDGSAPGGSHLIAGTTSLRQYDQGFRLHFPQNPTNAGGNATMALMRFTRATTSTPSLIMTVFRTATGTGSYDYLYDSVCSVDTIRAAFHDSLWTYANSATVNTVNIPTALYFYWPFNNSKLRVHALAVEKFA